MEFIKNLEEHISNEKKKYEELKKKYEKLKTKCEKLESKYEKLECRNLNNNNNNNKDISSKISGSKIIKSSFCKDDKKICSKKKWNKILFDLFLSTKNENGYDYLIQKIKNNNNFNYCDKKKFNEMGENKKGYHYHDNLQLAIQNKSAYYTYKEIKYICNSENIEFIICFQDNKNNIHILQN